MQKKNTYIKKTTTILFSRHNTDKNKHLDNKLQSIRLQITFF